MIPGFKMLVNLKFAHLVKHYHRIDEEAFNSSNKPCNRFVQRPDCADEIHLEWYYYCI